MNGMAMEAEGDLDLSRILLGIRAGAGMVFSLQQMPFVIWFARWRPARGRQSYILTNW
jgi:hypothetical protein